MNETPRSSKPSQEKAPASSAPQTAYWSPEWVEGALTGHLRKLGCKCPKPLIGYSPGFGPRCRLCNVDAESTSAPQTERLIAELKDMEARKDAAYEERNRVVAALAHLALVAGFKAGTARTAIEGWSDDWHGCVYIEGPWGQASWHFHDSHGHLFWTLPPYDGAWDGHTTEQKYERLGSVWQPQPSQTERLLGELEKEIEALPRIVPSEMEAEAQWNANGEYVSWFSVQQVLAALRASSSTPQKCACGHNWASHTSRGCMVCRCSTQEPGQ